MSLRITLVAEYGNQIVTARPTSSIVSIQYLRAVAALGVIIFHIGEPYGLELKLGGAGVDLFFVISGFIMWMVTQKRETTPTVFFARRVMRIVPLYWSVTLILAIGASLKPNLFPVDHPTAAHIIKSLLFIPHLSPTNTTLPLIGQGWTLNYEMFFYVVFAFALCFARRSQLSILSAIFIGLVLLGAIINPTRPWIMAYTSPLMLEFLMGLYIGHIWTTGYASPKLLAWSAIIVGVSGLIIFAAFTPDAPRWMIRGIPAASVLFGFVMLERKNAILNVASLKLMGDASYSIYLTHYLSMLAIDLLAVHLGIRHDMKLYMFTIVGAVFIGTIFYKLIEQPINIAMHKIFGAVVDKD